MVETLEQLMFSFLESQKNTWTVSDAVGHISKEFVMYQENCRTVEPVLANDCDAQLDMLKARMS